MKKTEIVNKIKVLLNIDVTLAQYTDAEGTVFEAESLEAGKVLFLVTPDGQVAASPGKYRFENQEVLIQDGGVIEEVIDLEVESELETVPEEAPAEVEATEEEEPPEPPETVTLEVHNALLQRVTDLEEVVETLTDALSQIRLEQTEEEVELEEATTFIPSQKKKLEASEQTEPVRAKPNSSVDRVFRNMQLTNA